MTDDNLRRIASASKALDHYEAGKTADDLVDLLTDLRHWAHSVGVEFDQALATSARHFEAELKE
jgi:hypothetical protein